MLMSKISPGTTIDAGQATAAGMPHLEVTVGRRPGSWDTIQVHLASGQALLGEHVHHQHTRQCNLNMGLRDRIRS